MQHLKSVNTMKNKVSLLNSSTINSQDRQSITVFIQHHFQRQQISLPLDSFTIQELIEVSLEKFSQLFDRKFKRKQDRWELYASKKNGKSYSDYPSLQPSQKVEKTGFCYFFLCKESEGSSSSSSSKIKTSFQEEQTRPEIKVKEDRSCLCFSF